MQVMTRFRGLVDVRDEQVLTVKSGLFGFEDYTEFALLESEYSNFLWLQSTENKDLAFLVIDPFVVCPDYETDIDNKELAKIGISEPSQVLVLTLVTVPKDESSITTNLLGPLVINKQNRQAMQVILNDPKWTVKYDIMKALRKEGR